MVEIQKFLLYGENDPQIEEAIQPRLGLRNWSDLGAEEKKIALQYLLNKGLPQNAFRIIPQTIEILNHDFLRQCPGKRLHKIGPERKMRGSDNRFKRMEAAFEDFKDIFVNEKSDAMVLRMLSQFAENCIDSLNYEWAVNEKNKKKREELVEKAFEQFDKLTNCLNHIFEQFSVNVQLTRNGLIPKQDEKITAEIYEPTLKILADPKWKTVSDELALMFEDYRERNHPEVITKAHSVVQRFLQILVGEEGKSGKGEFGKLFRAAKKEGLIPADRFAEPIIAVFQGFIASERATKSSAKPALKDASPSDALLMMNVVMVFLQYCLQHTK